MPESFVSLHPQLRAFPLGLCLGGVSFHPIAPPAAAVDCFYWLLGVCWAAGGRRGVLCCFGSAPIHLHLSGAFPVILSSSLWQPLCLCLWQFLCQSKFPSPSPDRSASTVWARVGQACFPLPSTAVFPEPWGLSFSGEGLRGLGAVAVPTEGLLSLLSQSTS